MNAKEKFELETLPARLRALASEVERLGKVVDAAEAAERLLAKLRAAMPPAEPSRPAVAAERPRAAVARPQVAAERREFGLGKLPERGSAAAAVFDADVVRRRSVGCVMTEEQVPF